MDGPLLTSTSMHRAIKQRQETIAVHWPEDIGKESRKNATLQGQNNEQAKGNFFLLKKKRGYIFAVFKGQFFSINPLWKNSIVKIFTFLLRQKLTIYGKEPYRLAY